MEYLRSIGVNFSLKVLENSALKPSGAEHFLVRRLFAASISLGVTGLFKSLICLDLISVGGIF